MLRGLLYMLGEFLHFSASHAHHGDADEDEEADDEDDRHERACKYRSPSTVTRHVPAVSLRARQ